MRTDRIVVDVEIAKTIEETPGGWDATDLLGVSCAGVYEENTDRLILYGPDDVAALRARLLKAEEIIGYNVLRFDLPVIFGVSRHGWRSAPRSGEPALDVFPNHECDWDTKTNDLLLRIWRALGLPDKFSETHKGWGLDAVCRGTIGRGKIGWGGDAPKWFQAGQWAKLATYCLDDVILERDLDLFVERYGYVVNGDSGKVVRLP